MLTVFQKAIWLRPLLNIKIHTLLISSTPKKHICKTCKNIYWSKKKISKMNIISSPMRLFDYIIVHTGYEVVCSHEKKLIWTVRWCDGIPLSTVEWEKQNFKKMHIIPFKNKLMAKRKNLVCVWICIGLWECREKYRRIYTRLFAWFGGKDTPTWENKEKERERMISKKVYYLK